MRRLRYIRSLIAERRRYDIEVGEESERTIDRHIENTTNDNEQSEKTIQFRQKHVSVYDTSKRNHEYLKSVLGTTDEDDLEAYHLYEMQYGPEQTAVYSREYARVSYLKKKIKITLSW